MPLVEKGFQYDYLQKLSIFEVTSLSSSISRRSEMEAANQWYSQTESKIYSKAREKAKDRTTELSDNEIEAKEEELRKKYYIQKTEVINNINPNEKEAIRAYHNASYENYCEKLSKIKEKLERVNN